MERILEKNIEWERVFESIFDLISDGFSHILVFKRGDHLTLGVNARIAVKKDNGAYIWLGNSTTMERLCEAILMSISSESYPDSMQFSVQTNHRISKAFSHTKRFKLVIDNCHRFKPKLLMELLAMMNVLKGRVQFVFIFPKGYLNKARGGKNTDSRYKLFFDYVEKKTMLLPPYIVIQPSYRNLKATLEAGQVNVLKYFNFRIITRSRILWRQKVVSKWLSESTKYSFIDLIIWCTIECDPCEENLAIVDKLTLQFSKYSPECSYWDLAELVEKMEGILGIHSIYLMNILICERIRKYISHCGPSYQFDYATGDVEEVCNFFKNSLDVHYSTSNMSRPELLRCILRSKSSKLSAQEWGTFFSEDLVGYWPNPTRSYWSDAILFKIYAYLNIDLRLLIISLSSTFFKF